MGMSDYVVVSIIFGIVVGIPLGMLVEYFSLRRGPKKRGHSVRKGRGF